MDKNCLQAKTCLNLINSRDIVLYNSPLQTVEKPCLWLEVSYGSVGPEESSVSGLKASLCSSEMNILNLLLNIRSWMFVYFRISCSPVHSAQQETKYGRETRRNRSVQLLSHLSESSSLSRLTVFITLDKLNSLKQDKLPISKPKVPLVTTKPTKQDRKQTTTFAPTTAGTRTCLESYLLRLDVDCSCALFYGIIPSRMFLKIVFFVYPASRQESWEDSELFKPQPSSDLDALGKKRYVGRWTHGLNPTQTSAGILTN